MKEIVLNLESEYIHITVYDYEKFKSENRSFLEELKRWIYLETDEEPANE